MAICKHCNGKREARPITPKQNCYFEINRAAVLAFQSIGKGHSGDKKVASILNIDKPINAHSSRGHTEDISEFSEKNGHYICVKLAC